MLATKDSRIAFARLHLDARHIVPADEVMADLQANSDVFDSVWDDSPISEKEFADMLDETIELVGDHMSKQEYFALVRKITTMLRNAGYEWVRTFSDKHKKSKRANGYRTKLFCFRRISMEQDGGQAKVQAAADLIASVFGSEVKDVRLHDEMLSGGWSVIFNPAKPVVSEL